MRNPGAYNFADNKNKTQTQLFIEAYKHLKAQGALDEDTIIEVAQDMTKEKIKERFGSQKESIGLVDSFVEAQETIEPKETPRVTVNIKGIFE